MELFEPLYKLLKINNLKNNIILNNCLSLIANNLAFRCFWPVFQTFLRNSMRDNNSIADKRTLADKDWENLCLDLSNLGRHGGHQVEKFGNLSLEISGKCIC